MGSAAGRVQGNCVSRPMHATCTGLGRFSWRVLALRSSASNNGKHDLQAGHSAHLVAQDAVELGGGALGRRGKAAWQQSMGMHGVRLAALTGGQPLWSVAPARSILDNCLAQSRLRGGLIASLVS